MQVEAATDPTGHALRTGHNASFAVGLTAALVWISAALPDVTAADPGEPSPASLRVTPAEALLRGPDAVQQLAIDALAHDREPRDVTRVTKFATSSDRVATIDDTGLITARGDGSARITIKVGEISATIPVTVKEFTAGVPVHFANQVVPIFTKLGCNAGGCHGKVERSKRIPAEPARL